METLGRRREIGPPATDPLDYLCYMGSATVSFDGSEKDFKKYPVFLHTCSNQIDDKCNERSRPAAMELPPGAFESASAIPSVSHLI